MREKIKTYLETTFEGFVITQTWNFISFVSMIVGLNFIGGVALVAIFIINQIIITIDDKEYGIAVIDRHEIVDKTLAVLAVVGWLIYFKII